MRTRPWRLLVFFCLLSCALVAQVASTGSASQTGTSAVSAAVDPEMSGILQQVEGSASRINLELGRLRVEKWKTDSASRRQAEGNIDSVQRNLTAALPSFVTAVRNSPQNIAPGFRLYRNLSALSKVLNSIAESAGAFGPKDQFERLAADINSLEAERAALGKRLESMAEAQAMEIAKLKTQLKGQPKAQPSGPPKVVVDDNAASRPNSSARQKPKPSPPAQPPPPQ